MKNICVMKKLGILIVVLLFAGCATAGTQRGAINAEFRIVKWWQAGDVYIQYTVTNIGNVPIGYYEVEFEATCEDGTQYSREDWGPRVLTKSELLRPIAVGEEWRAISGITVSRKKVISVKISDWKIRRRY